ncbi:hypothetical protein AB0B10_25210 [Micromonospora arborensis]|uniref:hypothetical protein n=1 Tax=Micromonospora arborensis TaxID=2116518 RepID=UPI0033CF0337
MADMQSGSAAIPRSLATRLLEMLHNYEGLLIDSPAATMTDDALDARLFTDHDVRDTMRALARQTGLPEPAGH